MEERGCTGEEANTQARLGGGDTDGGWKTVTETLMWTGNVPGRWKVQTPHMERDRMRIPIIQPGLTGQSRPFFATAMNTGLPVQTDPGYILTSQCLDALLRQPARCWHLAVSDTGPDQG
jgi:hypothetical protein